MARPYDIKVVDTVFDPSLPPNAPRTVYVRRNPDAPLYKVWLYLSGYDLPYVQSVTYILHPTFTDPIRTVPRNVTNPNCQLVIWTWGLFEVAATIRDKQDRTFEIRHQLMYDKELSGSDIKYIDE
ncbi:MAG TPA: pYEATS domain-containing protein [Blastocatellia bacterium]|nr:pYEATS domain-containing protein [Blastocatellia bacterium]